MKLKIFVKPNAKQSRLLKIENDVLHVALHAKPKDGEANAELIRFLSALLEIPKSQIILEKGESSRHKVVAVPITVVGKLEALLRKS